MNLDIASLPLPARVTPAAPMSDLELMRFSRANRPFRMEREENGDIVIMTPTGNPTGKINQRIGRLLDEWAEEDGRFVWFRHWIQAAQWVRSFTGRFLDLKRQVERVDGGRPGWLWNVSRLHCGTGFAVRFRGHLATEDC